MQYWFYTKSNIDFQKAPSIRHNIGFIKFILISKKSSISHQSSSSLTKERPGVCFGSLINDGASYCHSLIIAIVHYDNYFTSIFTETNYLFNQLLSSPLFHTSTMLFCILYRFFHWIWRNFTQTDQNWKMVPQRFYDPPMYQIQLKILRKYFYLSWDKYCWKY